MTFKNVIEMCMLFLVLPVWIGAAWTAYLDVNGKLKGFCTAWILGLATMFAAAQLFLVPMIAMEYTLTAAVRVFQIVLTVLAVISFFCVLHRMDEDADRVQQKKQKHGMWTAVFGVCAALLILAQALIPTVFAHIDDDDARFVSEEVSAVVHDTMLKDDPITDQFMYWNVGEVRKDLSSPWPMYAAMCSRIMGVAPAVFSHTLLPFFMILICYVLYGLLASELFDGDAEKTEIFLIALSVFNIWDFTSTHTLSAMILLRIWQGKAMVAGFIIPLFMYLFYRNYREDAQGRWIAPLYVVSLAASLLSGTGLAIAPLMLCVYGLLDFCYKRSVKRLAAIWAAAIPCGIYLLYYLSGVI